MGGLFSRLTRKVFGGGGKKMKTKPKKKKKMKKVVKKKKVVVRKKVIAKKKITTKKKAKKIVKKPVKVIPIKAKPIEVKKLTKAQKLAEKKLIKPVEIPPKPLKLPKGPHTVYLGIGSNVGDREEYIEQAIYLLSKTKGIKLVRKSSNYETEPEGQTDQPQFLNAAIQIKTMLDPYSLLSVVQETENALGREREVEWGPRTIDVDILLFGDVIVSDDKLQIPHPLLHERLFVLQPLAEIAPKVQHPILEKEIRELYDERKNEAGEKYDDELPGFKEIRKGTPDDYERW